MNILLLNAGSSSLKASLMDAAKGVLLARGSADWAGPVTHYQFVGPDGGEHLADVTWRGCLQAVQRFASDLMETEPVAVAGRSELAAVAHRVVHGWPFTAPAGRSS